MPLISVCLPYHNNPRMLSFQYDCLAALDPFWTSKVELVVCDDASTEAAHAPRRSIGQHISVQILRIPPPHVPWSHRVASNIAAKEARAEWLLMTDMDHVVTQRAWSGLFDRYHRLDRDRVYTFSRINMDGSSYKAHPDSWLIHRRAWEKIGGYDERYRGHYGQNYPFIARVQHYFPVEGLPFPLMRVSRDDIPDASERELERKSPEAKAAIAAIRQRALTDGTFFKDTRGSVEYERVYP